MIPPMPVLDATIVAAIADIPTVFAYVDPGAGGLLMQLLLAGVGGMLVALRMKGRRLLSRFRRPRRDS